MKKTHENSPHRKRTLRRDGQSTRDMLLEAAGQIFAEYGFAEATSKEICERAGVNSAAVNYYFGGKENLYEEVLIEGHRQLVNLDELDVILSSQDLPERKLRSFLAQMLRTAAASSKLWGIKVYLRELAAPSPFMNKTLTTTILPKAEKLQILIHEIMGLSKNSEQVQRALAFVVIPCLSLIMFPEHLRTQVLPASAVNTEDFLDDMMAYVLGGLQALARPSHEGT